VIDPLRVACAVDDAYAPHAAAMVRSVLVHAGRRAEVHLLHGPRLRASTVEAMARMVVAAGAGFTAHVIADEEVAGLPVMDRIGAVMWYRILLPDLLPHARRVLYLDADVLAVDALGPLWETDLAGAWLGAVTNVFERHRMTHPAVLGLPAGQTYFNSGVLLMDLEGMRRDGRRDAIARVARERPAELLWPDQDALNLALGERRLALHPRWNAMNSILSFAWADEILGPTDVAEARSQPGLVHFEGPTVNKPWHLLSEHPHREQYFAHRRGTPWPNVHMSGRTPANLARRALRDRSGGDH